MSVKESASRVLKFPEPINFSFRCCPCLSSGHRHSWQPGFHPTPSVPITAAKGGLFKNLNFLTAVLLKVLLRLPSINVMASLTTGQSLARWYHLLISVLLPPLPCLPLTYTHTHTRMHAHMHTHARIHIHTRACTCMHALAHTDTHTVQPNSLVLTQILPFTSRPWTLWSLCPSCPSLLFT